MKRFFLLLSIVSLTDAMDKKKKPIERIPSFVGSSSYITIPESTQPGEKSPKVSRSLGETRKEKNARTASFFVSLKDEENEKELEQLTKLDELNDSFKKVVINPDDRRPKIPYMPPEEQEVVNVVVSEVIKKKHIKGNPPKVATKAKSEGSLTEQLLNYSSEESGGSAFPEPKKPLHTSKK